MNNSDTHARSIVIHTDGACSCNPGPGGWGAVICYQNGASTAERLELSGGASLTTNNRMELSAVVAALAHVQEREDFDAATPVSIISDSKYVVNGFTEWLPRWKEKNWRGSDKKPVKNQDLWKWLDFTAADFNLSFQWVKGHAGNPENEAADALASAAIPAPAAA